MLGQALDPRIWERAAHAEDDLAQNNPFVELVEEKPILGSVRIEIADDADFPLVRSRRMFRTQIALHPLFRIGMVQQLARKRHPCI